MVRSRKVTSLFPCQWNWDNLVRIVAYSTGWEFRVSLLANIRGYSFLKKRLAGGCEANHTPPSSTDGKNEWGCTLLFLNAFIACATTALPIRRLRKIAKSDC
jgi:hypothetical protein